jgi:tetratricopeptide (TPR) repeat protein
MNALPLRSFACVTLLSLGLTLAGCGKTPPPEPAARSTAQGRQGATEEFVATMQAFAQNQDRAKAEEGLRRSAALDASYVPARINLARFAEARREWGEAIRWQGEIVTNGDIESSLAAKTEVARLQKIFTEWQTCDGRRNIEYNLGLARALIDAKKFSDAATEAEAARSLDKDRPEAYAVLAEAAARQEHFAEALRFLDDSVQRTPEERKNSPPKPVTRCSRSKNIARPCATAKSCSGKNPSQPPAPNFAPPPKFPRSLMQACARVRR